MRCGWWPCLYCSGPHRRRHPHGTDLSCHLLRSGRRDSPQTKQWAASVQVPLICPEVGHFVTTRWSPSGCLPPGRRAQRDPQVSLPRQRGGGRCGAASPLHELWKLRRTQRLEETVKSIKVQLQGSYTLHVVVVAMQ